MCKYSKLKFNTFVPHRDTTGMLVSVYKSASIRQLSTRNYSRSVMNTYIFIAQTVAIFAEKIRKLHD